MDLSYLLRTCAQSDISRVFCKGNTLILPLSHEGLSVRYTLCSSSISADVLTEDGDEYMLFNVSTPPGAFVSMLRQEAEDKLRILLSSSASEKDAFISYIEGKYGVEPDYPWEGDGSAVFRVPGSGKWFALLMRIPASRLGFGDNSLITVVNLKHDSSDIPSVIDRKTVFPAWHMSRTHWITVLLSAESDWENIGKLVDRSYFLVKEKQGKKKKRG